MKNVYIALFAIALALPTFAQDAPEPPPSTPTPPSQSLTLPALGVLDANSLLKSLRTDFVLDSHRNKWAGGHLPLVWAPKDSEQAVFILNGGVLWETGSGGPSGPFISLGARLDNLSRRIGLLPWVSRHVAMIALPAIELGPYGGYITTRSEWSYGLFVATKLGK